MEDDGFDNEDPQQQIADTLGMMENIDDAISTLAGRIAGNGTGEQYLNAFLGVFLAARTLYTDYFSVSLATGKIDTSLMQHVEQALQRAHDALSEEEFPSYRQQIRDGIRTIIHLPQEILKLEE